MCTLAHQLRELRMPSAESGNDAWRQLEGPGCFVQQARINSGVLLAPRGSGITHGSRGVTRDPFQREVALSRRGVREGVHDVDFDIHKAAVTKL